MCLVLRILETWGMRQMVVQVAAARPIMVAVGIFIEGFRFIANIYFKYSYYGRKIC